MKINSETHVPVNINSITSVFGEARSREEVLNEINKDPLTKETFLTFPEEYREKTLLFLEGKRSLQILEDKFFQHIFRPDTDPERLKSLLSAILGQEVKSITPLPREGFQIYETGRQVILDIIAELDDGSIVNIEMQRIGYLFPGQRTNCYLSDMTMRQYTVMRSKKGKQFTYKSMKPVRLIVIMDKSSAEFKAVAPEYIHNRITSYSSGAEVTDLEHVTYISLDTYRDLDQNKINNKLDAWLTFFSFDDEAHVIELINHYPEFLSVYQDIAEFRKRPGEVIGMFSEALKTMDDNTTLYMIDEMHQTIADLTKSNADKDKTIADKDSQIDKLQAILKAKNIEIPS